MNILANTNQLTKCLDIMEKALPVRSTIPVISNILFEIKGKEMIFSSTNLEMFIKAKMDYQGEETGKILLPPKIVEVMRYFPTTDVNLNINWENYRIDISGGSAHFHLYGSNPEDYPLSFESQLNDNEGFVIEKSSFKKLLKSVVFAASNEETRPAFNGIFFLFNNDMISLTASDTYRLAIKEVKDDHWNFEESRSLVPARSMRELLRILSDGEGEISLINQENLISFKFDQIFFASRLLEEKYPDVSGVIPTEYKTRIVIDRKMFEEIINRAALLAEGKNQAVNIIVKNQYLEARVSAQEGSMEENIPVEQKGEDLDLFVNSRFILDVLKVIEDQKVVIDFHGDGGPLIFRLIDDQSYLYLVLPIKKVN
jgi:DNA polymerase III subunit beta